MIVRIVSLLVALSILVNCEDVEAIVKEAMREALRNIVDESDKISETINVPDTQKADETSIDAQRIGDIMQETTRILSEKKGSDFLTQLEGINALDLLDTVITDFGSDSSSARRKRQYGGGTANASTPARDPLDVNCIQRSSTCDANFPFRSISGWCNHADSNRAVGSTLYKFRRFMGAAKYDDGFNSVRRVARDGSQLPSARVVSNVIFKDATLPVYDKKYNHFHMQFGQFIAHDIIFTPTAVGPNNQALDCTKCSSANLTSNCAPIEVPKDDSYFPTKAAAGDKGCIRLTRAINGQTGLGPRQQINQNTHFLDLSDMYGSSDCVASDLRTKKGGELKVHTLNGFYLPPQDPKDANCQSSPKFPCFSAGDSRNSLHPGLLPFHAMYLKQHNQWAREIQSLRKTWSDNLIYEETRRLTIAVWQHHVYAEYLPTLVGLTKMKEFDLTPNGQRSTYKSNVDPSIGAEFGTAAFRFGHTQVRKDIPKADTNNRTQGSEDLGRSIFYTDMVYEKPATVSQMTMGMMKSAALAVDGKFSFPVRNQMFETRNKKASGVDLPAVNVQRGREMGVHPYNDVRQRIGLGRLSTFEDLRSAMEQPNIDLLKQVYKHVDDIDLYAGLLLEKRTDSSALLGPTGSHLIADQFSALKQGDRFFYASTDNAGSLTAAEYKAVTGYSMAQFVCEHNDGIIEVPANIFDMNGPKVRCNTFKPFPLKDILY